MQLLAFTSYFIEVVLEPLNWFLANILIYRQLFH